MLTNNTNYHQYQQLNTNIVKVIGYLQRFLFIVAFFSAMIYLVNDSWETETSFRLESQMSYGVTTRYTKGSREITQKEHKGSNLVGLVCLQGSQGNSFWRDQHNCAMKMLHIGGSGYLVFFTFTLKSCFHLCFSSSKTLFTI